MRSEEDGRNKGECEGEEEEEKKEKIENEEKEMDEWMKNID